jgi:AcrR family transcriptional regulator
MTVKGDSGHAGDEPARRTQAERSAATTQALLAAARRRFAAEGFAAAREDIVKDAGVTRGALYHHFASKRDLFRAVVENIEEEVLARVAAEAMRSDDPSERLRRGCQAFLDSATDPDVRRILLLDAPAVLGWSEWREIDARYALGLVVMALEETMEAGQMTRRPVEPLAHLLLAALNEAALLVAGADDPGAARQVLGGTVDDFLTAFGVPARPAGRGRAGGPGPGATRPRRPR